MPNIDWSKMKTAQQVADDARRSRVPLEITRSQGRAILARRGLKAAVEAYIAGITDAEEAELADLAWNHTTTWVRFGSPFLTQAANALGISDLALDEMFIEAAQIQI